MNTTQAEFLTILSWYEGAVAIPEAVARQIRETCILQGKPLLFAAPRPNPTILHAVWKDNGFLLNLGNPNDPLRLPTWGEYIDYYGVDMKDEDERAEFFERTFFWSRYEEEPEPAICLDREISGDILDVYCESDFLAYVSPLADAYRYLEDIEFFEQTEQFPDNPLGEIRFIEACESKTNIPYVWARDLASLACLQHRLNQLGENTIIEIFD
jgi:hypothetical protein